MISDVGAQIVGWWLLGLFVLHIINYHWFKTAVETSVMIVFRSGQLLAAITNGLLRVIPTAARGVLKALVVGALLIVLFFVYLFTFIVPHVGQYTLKFRDRLEGIISTSLLDRALALREIMVDIIVKHDDRELDFESQDQYRKELNRVKQQGKTRLDTGETVLSVALGAVLIGGTVSGVDIFSQSIYRYSVGTLIEIWLLVIAVSIIYRSTILELIAYSTDAEFQSLDEMDAALSFQKGVSLHGFFQGLVSGVFLAFGAISVPDKLMKELLEMKYTGGPWIRTAFKRLLN